MAVNINEGVAYPKKMGNDNVVSKQLSPSNYEVIPVLALGDSITAQNTSSLNRNPHGYMTALQFYSKERFDWRHTYNHGVSGDTTAMIVSRLAAVQTTVRSYGIKCAVFMAGTNDVEAGVATSVTNDNYIQILDYLIDTCGLDVFVFGSVPRLGFVGNATKIASNKTNDSNLAARCAERQRCTYIPLYNTFGGGTDTPLDNYMLADGTHPAPTGAFIMGKLLSDAMTAVYGVGGWDYGERNYLDGEVLNNLTAGSKVGIPLTVVTGNTPTGWYNFGTNNAAVSLTFAKQPNGAMRITLSSTGGTTASLSMFKNIASGSYSLNDFLQAQMDVDIISCSNVRAVTCRMVDDATPDITYDGMTAAYTGVVNSFPIIGRGVIATHPVQLSSNNTAVNMQIGATIDNTSAPASVVFDVYRVKVRKVLPYKQKQVDASGTAYTLTATSAAVTFGTTSPNASLIEAGTYLIIYDAVIKYVGATFAASKDITLKLRRTNNTAADLSGSSRTVSTDTVTTKTATMLSVSGSCIYDTNNIDDAIALYADITELPSAGSVTINAANIRILKLPRQTP